VRKARLPVALLVMASIVMVPAVAAATPDDSQRLRGMAGRTFEVHVTGWVNDDTGVPQPVEFDNCYTFAEGGLWIDPLFPDPAAPAPGMWEQHSPGAATTYTASSVAELGGGFAIAIVQEGSVTPAQGHGVTQLHASNTLTLTIPGLGELPWGELSSTGSENPDC
jgi:hypothetical protein